MAKKKLVLIESPGKLSSFKKYLGSEFDVVATYGHCIDLPEDELAIDIKKDFEAKFAVKDDHKDVIKSIKSMAKNASDIYLMTDEDREGEAISYNILNEIKGSTSAKVFRATTNEITSKGILQAIKNAGDIDMQKINSYLARRILDRLCGYKTSYLTKMATGGRSAGRVQSAILRIIADRENEILNFKPEEFWILMAHLLSSKGEPYKAEISEKVKIKTEKHATEIYNNVIKSQPVVKSVESKQVKTSPYPPFTTMPLIQASSTIFGWSAKKTMQVAQSLYEGGLITYMRTDSPVMSEEAVAGIRHYISGKFGNNYLPESPKIYSAKKGAQEAHECCRPTDINIVDPHIESDERKMYQMIWNRAVASQMVDGKDERMKVVTQIGDYDFISNGKVLVFDGYRKCWTYSLSDDIVLPELKQGEICKFVEGT